MKMYIMVKDNVPNNFVPVVCAHAALACYLEYQDTDKMKFWLDSSFKKVVCKVNQEEWYELSKLDEYNITTESSLNDMEVAITFCPRFAVDGTNFSKYKLWSV